MATAGVLLGGCQQPRDDGPPIVRDGPPPALAEAAAAYNARIAPLTSLRAAAVVRIEFVNEAGERRREQGEGRLQVVGTQRVALDVGKLSETLLWLGCDGERYWWLDLTGGERLAYSGRHDGFDRSRARSLGVVVPPLDLLGLIGAAPLETTRGGTQWSADGRWLGIVTPAGRAGTRRTWVDPATYEPKMVELFDDQGVATVAAELSLPQLVAISGSGRLGPSLPSRVRVSHIASGALLTLDLADLSDGKGRISDDAFRLEALCRAFGVARVVDLDAGGEPRGGR